MGHHKEELVPRPPPEVCFAFWPPSFPYSILSSSAVAHIYPLSSWKPLTKYPSKRWVALPVPGALHSGNCSSRAGMLGLLLAVGLAGSLVAMAAAGLEPPNHFIHSSAGSESLPARKLGLWGGG